MIIKEIRFPAQQIASELEVKLIITGVRRLRYRMHVAGWLIALAQKVSGNKFELVDARTAP